MAIKYLALPGQRVSPDQFWLGLAIIAMLDGIRVSILGGASGFISFLPILFLLSMLHTNRLRSVGRSGALFFIPLIVGFLAKTLGALIGITLALFPVMMAKVEETGVDMNDDAAVAGVLSSHEFNASFRAYIESNPHMVAELAPNGLWPAMILFWLVMFGFGFWFTQMRSRAGAL
ncbi:hypothetical protein [Woodsholea maritima]|uniref:hypothetical protein n=1 Tax=Woodsholea maritima TaxID=240237 RepID=UPI0003694C05|nr:hypothetical protein [Woodsholea maritima]